MEKASPDRPHDSFQIFFEKQTSGKKLFFGSKKLKHIKWTTFSFDKLTLLNRLQKIYHIQDIADLENRGLSIIFSSIAKIQRSKWYAILEFLPQTNLIECNCLFNYRVDLDEGLTLKEINDAIAYLSDSPKFNEISIHFYTNSDQSQHFLTLESQITFSVFLNNLKSTKIITDQINAEKETAISHFYRLENAFLDFISELN